MSEHREEAAPSPLPANLISREAKAATQGAFAVPIVRPIASKFGALPRFSDTMEKDASKKVASPLPSAGLKSKSLDAKTLSAKKAEFLYKSSPVPRTLLNRSKEPKCIKSPLNPTAIPVFKTSTKILKTDTTTSRPTENQKESQKTRSGYSELLKSIFSRRQQEKFIPESTFTQPLNGEPKPDDKARLISSGVSGDSKSATPFLSKISQELPPTIADIQLTNSHAEETCPKENYPETSSTFAQFPEKIIPLPSPVSLSHSISKTVLSEDENVGTCEHVSELFSENPTKPNFSSDVANVSVQNRRVLVHSFTSNQTISPIIQDSPLISDQLKSSARSEEKHQENVSTEFQVNKKRRIKSASGLRERRVISSDEDCLDEEFQPESSSPILPMRTQLEVSSPIPFSKEKRPNSSSATSGQRKQTIILKDWSIRPSGNPNAPVEIRGIDEIGDCVLFTVSKRIERNVLRTAEGLELKLIGDLKIPDGESSTFKKWKTGFPVSWKKSITEIANSQNSEPRPVSHYSQMEQAQPFFKDIKLSTMPGHESKHIIESLKRRSVSKRTSMPSQSMAPSLSSRDSHPNLRERSSRRRSVSPFWKTSTSTRLASWEMPSFIYRSQASSSSKKKRRSSMCKEVKIGS